jgi:hypothetical protein
LYYFVIILLGRISVGFGFEQQLVDLISGWYYLLSFLEPKLCKT